MVMITNDSRLFLFFKVFCVDVLHTVDFVHPSGQCMFRTCEQEKGKVIFQLVSTVHCINGCKVVNLQGF